MGYIQDESKPAKILLLDVESAYMTAGVWERYKQDISMDQVFQDRYLLCWAAKWLDSKEMLSDALFEHATAYRKDPTNDKQILTKLWKLLNEADYVVAHNGAGFDIPLINARFIAHGMRPPSPVLVIDTLKIAKSRFKFSSNRLDDICKTLKIGGKMPTGGFALWRRIIENQDLPSFRHMVRYNKQDVKLLEKLYLKLRPWDHTHPNVNLFGHPTKPMCPSCGSLEVMARGWRRTVSRLYKRYVCKKCHHWSSVLTPEKKRPTLRSL